MALRLGRLPTVFGLLIAAASCRSILDITPGRPLEDASDGGASAGKSSPSKAGSPSTTGGSGTTQDTGGSPATAGKANGGRSGGGDSANGGVPDTAGAGGDTDQPPGSPFPEGSCRDCIARDCPTEGRACEGDRACAAGVATWLACTEADATDCIDSAAGPLQDLETCGATSCDLCRHLDDGAPAVEILTPSNGASFALDASGLIQVSVRVHNAKLKALGQCGSDASCGHVHINLDGANCRINPYYNAWIIAADAEGNAEVDVNTAACVESILDRPLTLTASLSDYLTHGDRVPAVQSTVTITISE